MHGLPCSQPCTAGVLALLDEPEDDMKVFALMRLDELVDIFWAEISEDVSKMSVMIIVGGVTSGNKVLILF